MSRYSSRNHRYSRFNEYPEYVSVDERKQRNTAAAAKLKEKNQTLEPIHIEGTKIAKTFWGKAWCDNIQSYQDYSNRLPRGRSYVRTGAVLDLKIEVGEIKALVAGSGRKPYSIVIKVKPLSAQKWEAIKTLCFGKISSLLAIAQGQLSDEIIKAFCNQQSGLFPAPNEIEMKCSCPDWSDLCKHLAAVLYGVGARLDTDPMLFFKLRHINEKELVGGDIVDTLTQGVAAEVAEDDLSSVFGIEFDSIPMGNKPVPEVADVAPTKPTRIKKSTKAKSVNTAKAKPVAKVKTPSKAAKVPVSIKAKALAAKATTPKPWTPNRVRNLRATMELSQDNFAKHLSTYAMKISLWERGCSPIQPQYHTILDKLEAQYGAKR